MSAKSMSRMLLRATPGKGAANPSLLIGESSGLGGPAVSIAQVPTSPLDHKYLSLSARFQTYFYFSLELPGINQN